MLFITSGPYMVNLREVLILYGMYKVILLSWLHDVGTHGMYKVLLEETVPWALVVKWSTSEDAQLSEWNAHWM